MVCLTVWRDNPAAVRNGLSTIQVNKACSISLVARYPSVDLAYLVLEIWVSGIKKWIDE